MLLGHSFRQQKQNQATDNHFRLLQVATSYSPATWRLKSVCIKTFVWRFLNNERVSEDWNPLVDYLQMENKAPKGKLFTANTCTDLRTSAASVTDKRAILQRRCSDRGTWAKSWHDIYFLDAPQMPTQDIRSDTTRTNSEGHGVFLWVQLMPQTENTLWIHFFVDKGHFRVTSELKEPKTTLWFIRHPGNHGKNILIGSSIYQFIKKPQQPLLPERRAALCQMSALNTFLQPASKPRYQEKCSVEILTAV